MFWRQKRINGVRVNCYCASLQRTQIHMLRHFMVKKSNFVAFFQDTFSLCGITPNHLRLRLALVEIVFFPRI